MFHLFRQAAARHGEPHKVDDAIRRNDEAYTELRTLVHLLLDQRNGPTRASREPET